MEHLCQWLIAEMCDDSPDATNWLKVVAILLAVFHNTTLAKEFTWHTCFLIPKGKGGLWGIGLVKVLWKAVSSLLNRRLTAVISYHDALHRFLAGWGTGTTALEANMLQ